MAPARSKNRIHVHRFGVRVATQVLEQFGLAVLGLIAIVGFLRVNIEETQKDEQDWLEKRIEAGDVKEDPEKVWQPEDNDAQTRAENN